MKRKPKAAKNASGRDWAKQLRLDVEYAKAALLKDGELPMLTLVHTQNAVIPILGLDTIDKEDAYRVVTLICTSVNAIGISWLAEAWSAAILPGEDIMRPIRPPSEREDRTECLVVNLQYRDDAGVHNIADSYEIVRDFTNGKITQLKRSVDDETTYSAGDFVPHEDVSEAERRTAAADLEAMGISLAKLMRAQASRS